MRRSLLIAGGAFLVLTLTAIGIGVGLYLGSSDGTQPLQNGTETVVRDQLAFHEAGQALVQEQIFSKETGTLEVRVPPHSNYTESVFLASEGEILLSTNGTCQLSETPQESGRTTAGTTKQEDVKGLPLPWGVPQSSTYYVAKARKTRVTSSKREALKSAQNAECANHAIVKTEDYAVPEEDYKKMQDGGVAIIRDEVKTRGQGCIEARVCTAVGPGACGYTGWKNPVTGEGFSFHQVSSGSICVTCKLKDWGPFNECDTPGACWCEEITDKEKLMNCVFNNTAQHTQVDTDEPGRKKRSVMTQTTTYSRDKFDEKSFKIEVPPHQGNDGLTVVMHAASNGYWHTGIGLSNLKDNMLFKKGDQCLITTIPAGFYPIDGALGMKEIVDVLEKKDSLVEHSALIDEGPMTGASLKPPIQEECSASFIRKVTPTKLTTEQAAILEEGGVVLLSQISTGGCTLRKALISTSAKSSWYWPNQGTGSEVALKKTLHDVKHLTCCANPLGQGASQPCCKNLCLCDKITSRKNFLDCQGNKAELLLVATGYTDQTGSEYASSQIQMYKKDAESANYTYVLPTGCKFNVQKNQNPTLPSVSSLGTGIVLPDESITLCEGYTPSGVRKCYKYTHGQGFQARPGLDIPRGGQSVLVRRDDSLKTWWVAAADAKGVTSNIFEASLDTEESLSEQPLPEPLKPLVCFTRIPATGSIDRDFVLLSGVPTTSSSNGNKNWIRQVGKTSADDSNWVPLPDSLEQRLGGSCGILRQNSATAENDSTVVVLAGGYQSSTSEVLVIPDTLLESTWTESSTPQELGTLAWQMGPDVGERRSGLRLASMSVENEVLMVGGVNQVTKEFYTTIKVLNATLNEWTNNTRLSSPAVSNAIVLPLPEEILFNCEFVEN